jgi:methionyl-tRNA formyltransferase
MKVEEGLDTGPVYACRAVPVASDFYLPELRDQLVELGSDLLVQSLAGGVGGLPAPRAQEGVPTIASKLTPQDYELHWEREAVHLHRVVRLGRAWTTFRGRRLGILRASPVETGVGAGAFLPGALKGTSVITGHGTLDLEEVQPESRAPMAAADWARGARPSVGERLGSD